MRLELVALLVLGTAFGCSDDGPMIYNSLFSCFPDADPDEPRLEAAFEATLASVEGKSTRCHDARPVTLLTFTLDDGGSFAVGLENVSSRDWAADLEHRFGLLLDVTRSGWASRDHIELYSDSDLVFAYDESSSGLEETDELWPLEIEKDGPFVRIDRTRCGSHYQFAMTVRSNRDTEVVNPGASTQIATSRGDYVFTNHANLRLGDVGCTDVRDKVARYSVLKR